MNETASVASVPDELGAEYEAWLDSMPWWGPAEGNELFARDTGDV